MSSHWRAKARVIIRQVLHDTKGQDEKVIRQALRDAYPFGERAMHPYKIWLDEIRVQRGLKKKKSNKSNDIFLDPRQEEMFGDSDE